MTELGPLADHQIEGDLGLRGDCFQLRPVPLHPGSCVHEYRTRTEIEGAGPSVGHGRGGTTLKF